MALLCGDEMAAKEITSTITSKGQVTIPAEVRRQLELKPGDKIVFVVEEAGQVRLVAPKYPDIQSLRGAAGSLAKPLSWKKMRAIAREDQAAEHDVEYGAEHGAEHTSEQE
jgi:antitoxin PrlF